MSVGQKLTILKICLTIVTVMILGSLEAAPEEALQLRGLIKGSNWSLGHYLFGRHEFWKFWPPIAQIPGGGSHEPPPSWSPPEKRPALIGLMYFLAFKSFTRYFLQLTSMAIFSNVYFLPVVQSFNINIAGVCWTRQGVNWYDVHTSKIYTVHLI